MSQSKASLKWLHHNSKNIYGQLILLTLLAVLMAYCSVELAVASKYVIDIATGAAADDITKRILVLIVLILIQLIVQIVYARLNIRVTGRYTITLKGNLFNTLLKKDWQAVSDYHSGELLHRINSDISIIAAGVTTIIPTAFSLTARIVLAFYYLFRLDKELAIICLVLGPLVMLATRVYGKKMKTLHKKVQATDGKTKSFMQEALQNLLVIKAYKNENNITNASSKLQFDNYKYVVKRNNISIAMNILFFLALTVGSYFALVYCAFKISQGLMTAGTLVAILNLIGMTQTPFKDLSALIPQYYSTVASVERIIELEQLKNDYVITDVSQTFDSIEIQNLDFAYKEEQIFKHINLSFHKGDFLAICGISGIGKSTLMKLMMGILTPNAGKISIIEKGREVDRRNLFSYVPQGNMILSGTIKENIAFYSPLDEEKIIKAAKTAEIYDFVETLPDKFDTMLGEKGLGLSEGQIQRLAIARAVYFNAPIILLDEATSALDEQTEYKVIQNMKQLKDKSCMIISHKQAAFTICNKRLAIKDMDLDLEA